MKPQSLSIWRKRIVKKLIFLLLAFLMISGCLTWGGLSSDKGMPWYGITDPNFNSHNIDK